MQEGSGGRGGGAGGGGEVVGYLQLQMTVS